VILILEGTRVSGKNAVLAALCNKQIERGKKVLVPNKEAQSLFKFPTILLNLDNIIRVSPEVQSLNNCILALPGSYQYFNSRNHLSKVNRLFSHFAITSRHTGLDIYITALVKEYIDKRVREASDLIGTCTPNPLKGGISVNFQIKTCHMPTTEEELEKARSLEEGIEILKGNRSDIFTAVYMPIIFPPSSYEPFVVEGEYPYPLDMDGFSGKQEKFMEMVDGL